MRHYCTYFDHRYLPRGLALYDSLKVHGGDFTLWVLALSDRCVEILTSLALPHLIIVPLAELEAADPALLEAKRDRSIIEYYFTCTPAWTRHVLSRDPSIDWVTYLDSDLWFFSSPEPIFAELEGHSIGIIPHRYPPSLKHLEPYGLYNVGWVSFKRDAQGLACLEWYREKCLEWCFDRLEADRYGDQKYLDVWPERFAGVRVIAHVGANLAPWNLAGFTVGERDGQVVVADRPLVFYHYHGLKELRPGLFDPHLKPYHAGLTEQVKRLLYAPYLEALQRQVAALGPALQDVQIGNQLRLAARPQAGGLLEAVKKQLRLVRGQLAGHFLTVRDGRVV